MLPEMQIDLNDVEVVEGLGEWFVRVVDNGKTTSHSFDLESTAISFAAEQRLRLDLPEAA